MRRLFTILFALSVFVVVTAQTDEIMAPSAFAKSIESDMSKGLPENAKWVSSKFSPLFLSRSTPESIQDTIIVTVTRLQKKQVKTSSVILGYLKGVYVQLNTDSLDLALWDNWHVSITSMVENKKWRKKLSSYLVLSEGLFTDQIISNSRASKWQFIGGYMSMGVDSLPFVELRDGVLVCYAKGDSATVRATSGRFFPTLGVWVGVNGRVHWEGTTFNDSTQYAVLSDYEVKLSGSSFKTSPVEFHTELFDKVLVGDLLFKVQRTKGPEDRIYPRFESDSEKLYLKDFFPNMDFEGGIVVKGSRLDGTGVGDQPGYLKIYNNDTLFVRCSLNEIMFRKDGFGSIGSELAIYLGKDSIYHPCKQSISCILDS